MERTDLEGNIFFKKVSNVMINIIILMS